MGATRGSVHPGPPLLISHWHMLPCKWLNRHFNFVHKLQYMQEKRFYDRNKVRHTLFGSFNVQVPPTPGTPGQSVA